MFVLQLIATAALFLAAKSEETARPLNDVVKASCEIVHKQDLTFLSYMLPIVSIIYCAHTYGLVLHCLLCCVKLGWYCIVCCAALYDMH